MRTARIIACAALLAGCATASSGPAGSHLPLGMHAELIFVGRISAAEPTYLLAGDVVSEGRQLSFTAADQEGASITAIDSHYCAGHEPGAELLLVFLRRNPPSADRGPDQPYYVYACAAVDAKTAENIRQHEMCFRPDPPAYFCPER